MAFELVVMAAGDPLTQTNLISAPITAAVMRNVRGFDVGVLDNSFLSVTSTDENYQRTPSDMFTLSGESNLAIQIKAGMATAYGFDLYNDQTRVFSVGEYPALANAPSGQINYVFFYLKWDFSNPLMAVATIDVVGNASNPDFPPPNQFETSNLAEVPTGKYHMPLYRITIDQNGAVSDIQDWTKFGVQTYKGVKWSRLSDITNDAKSARLIVDRTPTDNNTASYYVGDKTMTVAF
ncbi:MAG: hypothetical protein FWD76_05465 [Firmicutes bacterium]|nr:hypothetical protein [Bacillota bacterium]